MPPKPEKQPESSIRTVPLFESAHEGYGDERYAGSQYRYSRVFRGWDTRYAGELRVGDALTTIAHASTINRPPIWAAEWRATNARYPVLVYIADAIVFQLQFGVSTSRITLGQVATGACFHDNGSGIQRLVVAEGDNGNIQIFDIAGSADTITGTVQRDKVASISGALYGSAIPASAVRWNGVTFVPYGSSPALAANWSSVTRVGWATTDINNIAGVRGVPCVLKPEGIFLYNRNLDLWENMMPTWEADPNPDNGRACVSLGPNLVIGRGSGGCVIFDGYSIKEFSPFGPRAAPGFDTTSQVFSALGIYRDWIAGATSVSRGYVGGSGSKEEHGLAGFATYNSKLINIGTHATEGLRSWKTLDNESTFTDYSTNSGDQDLTTQATWDALSPTAPQDFVYIGARFPFRAMLVEFDVGGAQVNTTVATLSAWYWDGSAWQTMALTDFTLLSGATLGQSGLIVFTGNPTDWAARAISTDTGTSFYIRLQPSTALSATVRPANIRVIPWRPAIDTTNFASEGQDRSGVYPHACMGRPGAAGGGWHDLGSVNAVDEIGAITVAPVGGATGSDPRKLVLLGRSNIYAYHLTEQSMWPWLQSAGLIEYSIFDPAGDKLVKLREVRLFGHDFDGLTTLTMYYRNDTGERWSKIDFGARPPFVHKLSASEPFGTQFQWALAYTMTQTEPIRRPVVIRIEADFEVMDGPPSIAFQTALSTIPRG